MIRASAEVNALVAFTCSRGLCRDISEVNRSVAFQNYFTGR